MTLVIMQPDDEPVTYMRAGSALYSEIAHLTMLASPVLSPLPSCVRDSLLETSQHLSWFGLLGKRAMKPLSSA